MPPRTLVTMPREIYGYTVPVDKNSLVPCNSTLSRNKAICFCTLYCTTAYKNRTLKSKFCFKFYPKCHFKSASELTLR